MAKGTPTSLETHHTTDETVARILIMEDDPAFAFWLKELLEAAGHQVDWARNGTDALHALENGSYDLLISDLYVYVDGKVTTDGGIKLIGRVKMRGIASRRNPGQKLPVIVISGATETQGNQFILQTAEGVGADYSLPKPVTEEQVLQVVAQALTGQPNPAQM